jgi:hypothetical protein
MRDGKEFGNWNEPACKPSRASSGPHIDRARPVFVSQFRSQAPEVGDCCEAERLKSASNLGVIVGRSKSTPRSTSASWCNNNNRASNQAKMTVCRFYQQGYCRFGSMKVAFSCPFLPSNNHSATPMRSSPSPSSCLSHVASSCWLPAGFLDAIFSCPTRHLADCCLLEN